MTDHDHCDDHGNDATGGPKPAPAAPRALEQAAAIFRAAGDEGRLRLLARLAQGEACASDLAAAEGEEIGAISARLRLLHGAQFVTRRRTGRRVAYAPADDHGARLIRDALDNAAEPGSQDASQEGN